MSIAQTIQNAWNTQAKWLVVLRPLSWIYRFGFLLNKQCYKSKLKATYHAPVPVMVIGNITVGGSGKTPLLIQLVKYLQQNQVAVGVISRGYGGQGPFPALVTSDSVPEYVGDEPCLIVQSTGVLMAVGANRQASIELLLKQSTLDLIISDDGLQHWALDRQLEWIVLDQNRGLGNQKLLPEGYLREPVSRLKYSTVVEHSSNPASELNMHLEVAEPYLLNPLYDQAELFDPNLDYYAVVGIGFPQRFYHTLESLGVMQFQCHEFPDHHDYEIDDIQFEDSNPIITTEKDAVKLLPLLKQHPTFKREIWVIPVEAVLSNQCYALLNHQLSQLGIQIA
ncbi:tetraacyldisaccharide 4'-kinase [Acinetobacter sp. ANC 4648]|uniref:tetraacyldisaccharide 4'-kinase n=1 Tax=Acinetobacter sp. ANC 4648 TaxID=1977875 RepID=UPI000A34C507|nr:tetraacyldisaccharide 4'-kinase [Acinetobacter sp. ANC 4648]OTG83005.1 tetraacyldisaccharide 4'-kinase [Acinetobacter sp. ANC 4648]